jgi:hypothetical protein
MSRKRRSIQLEQPPAEIIRGAQIIAEYLTQEVPQFRDNPLNEALPPTLPPREITEYLLQLPPYSDKDCEMSQVARLQMTETAREFFVPNGKHMMVYYAVINMIRRGYVRRNPVLWGYWKQQHQNIKSFLKAIKEKPFPNSRARGLAIVGSGGTGKSTTIEKILQSLPQVITHVSYKGQDFIMKQLVWLKLDCPRKGSLRELCVNFFRAADEVLDTQYEKRYAGNSHRTLEDLIAGIVRVAANHCLGIIVIDEIQDLSEARSGGDITMVNFFVHLENAIGVPFALIGTQDAIPILSAQFRQTRRVSEQGYYFWDRMSEVEPEIEEFEDDDDDDEEAAARPDISIEVSTDQCEEDVQEKTPRPDPVWKNFVETLWTYQYVKKPRMLKQNVVEDKCAHALYRVAKGIPAVVQTVFVLTQQLAILTEEERITTRLIHETAMKVSAKLLIPLEGTFSSSVEKRRFIAAIQHNQQVIKELLGEARMKAPRPIMPVGDLTDLDEIYEAEDPPYDFPTGATGNENINGISAEVDAGGNANVKAQSKKERTTTKSKAKLSPRTSGSKTNNSDKKLAPKRTRLSKEDIRNPAPMMGEQTKGGSSRTTDKYRKSPDEYLKGK